MHPDAAPSRPTPAGPARVRGAAWFVVFSAFGSLLGSAACGGKGGGDGDDVAWPFETGGRDGGDAARPDAAPTDTSRPELARPTLAIGEPCESDRECIGRTCIVEDGWVDGYCTSLDCVLDTDCEDEDALCAGVEAERYCAQRCVLDDECRDGYRCERIEGRAPSVCVPGERLTGAWDGEPCATDADCRGGTCLPDPYHPGGECTTLDCRDFLDCARGPYNNRCLSQPTGNLCARACEESDECRDGYLCQAVGPGLAVCAPGTTPAVPEGLDPEDYPIDIHCGVEPVDGIATFDYEIPEGTTAYMLTPFSLDGGLVSPLRVDLPSGAVIDFRGESNGFQLVPSYLFGFINPIVIPPIESLAAQLEFGTHTARIETMSESLCWMLLVEGDAGTTLDVNVHLVGVPGFEAPTAASNDHLQAVLDAFAEVLGAAGVELGARRYFDDDPSRSIIRSEFDAQELVALSAPPGESAAEALSLNVYFVQGFDFGSVIGISMGLPGAAGLHGTRSSGLVFTSEYIGRDLGSLGDGDVFTAVVMAHEVGHYLGLFHTTEMYSGGYDPLSDTPQCTRGFPDSCPDRTNLMFPLALGGRSISPQQAYQLLRNPLTR
ncbi:MAG: hypothetical protein H6700_01785 [Myxococcales bacterium]|nr:hypothetical protein [Myxococcales bacterium]MCB9519787.1 hypothetical protein [Myxococcales bacterium]MCB9530478.1 hypothetical protein [Myxococcales bacterium]